MALLSGHASFENILTVIIIRSKMPLSRRSHMEGHHYSQGHQASPHFALFFIFLWIPKILILDNETAGSVQFTYTCTNWWWGQYLIDFLIHHSKSIAVFHHPSFYHDAIPAIVSWGTSMFTCGRHSVAMDWSSIQAGDWSQPMSWHPGHKTCHLNCADLAYSWCTFNEIWCVCIMMVANHGVLVYFDT